MYMILVELINKASNGINQQGIKGLDLIELDASDNKKINDVSFMVSLKKLDA